VVASLSFLLSVAAPALAAVAAPALAASAQFRVGAAVATINPTYPVYMGGYGGGPAGGTITRHLNPLTGKPENFTVRAISIESSGHVVEFATVDTQGYFAAYQEGPYGISDVRNAVAAYLRGHGVPGAGSQDIVISSEHEHAAPTVIGIWGPASHQLPYLKQVAATLTGVLERAYSSARPATITAGQGDAPWVADRVIPEGNAFEGWPRDGSIGVLWARDARTRETIATYASEPGYPNIVFGPGDLLGPGGKVGAVLSSDFPNYADAYIEKRLGGIAIVTDGTLGNQTSAVQTDNVPSPDLPLQRGMRQTRAFDDIIHMGELIGNLVIGALAHRHPISTPTVGAAERYVQTPVDNPALLAIDYAESVGAEKLFATITGGNIYPSDRSFAPPYGDVALLDTWVTAIRVGGVLFLSMPGEFFPEIHAAWKQAISGTTGNFVVGAAQDFLGYEYPAYAFPFTVEGSDEHIFNPSVALGDQVVTAGEQDAQQLGFQVSFTGSPEFSALENDYLRAFRPGVQFLPFPDSGDLSPSGTGFTPTLEGLSQAPRVSSTGVCVADLEGPCPLKPAPMGAFRWNFGDGTTATTPPQVFARAWFSPFVHHRYCRPGVYPVTVTAADSSGQQDTMTLPIHVYPPLTAEIVRTGRRATGRVSGGDGTVLSYTWILPGGRVLHTRTIRIASSLTPIRLRITDGAGGIATASTWHRRPRAASGCVSRTY
jgi:hypothetical protein